MTFSNINNTVAAFSEINQSIRALHENEAAPVCSQIRMAPKVKSQGKQCAAINCFSREYMFIDGNRVPSGLKFYSFPLKDKAQLNHWCQLIRRQNNRDGFSVSKHSKICEKHFEKKYIYRPPGGTQTRLLKDAKPTLHEWNYFCLQGMCIYQKPFQCLHQYYNVH